MGDALHIHLLQQSQNGLDVDPGGNQQAFRNGLAVQLLTGHVQLGVIVVDVKDLPAQAEAVGVNAGGGQRQNYVAHSHAGVVDDLLLVHDAHGEAGQVIILHRHHAGMLGSLAADQGSAGLDTAFGHTADDLGDLLGDVLAAGNVVQEEQGLCAAADDVVDAHGHGVDADGVMLVHQDGQLDLGAAAVGAGDQHGLLIAGHGQAEAAAEAAHIVQAALVAGPGNVLLHQLHSPVTGGDVHTGGSVAGGIGILVIHDYVAPL